MAAFKAIKGFPGVWGLIDCTHVPVRVVSAQRKTFYNRKNITSINVQAVVGADMRFMDIVNRWPGSAHDSTIFKSSSIYAKLRENPGQGYLLGDAGYEIDTFIMTPYRSGSADSAMRKRFNKSHASTRNPIERTFGCWKSKFRCLQGMKITLDTALNVMTACAVLWNFLLAEGEKLLPEEEGLEEEQAIPEPVTSSQNSITQGNSRRDQISQLLATNSHN